MCNHNVEDRELLAINLALEEWWYWLEGATHMFIIFIWSIFTLPSISTHAKPDGFSLTGIHFHTCHCDSQNLCT